MLLCNKISGQKTRQWSSSCVYQYGPTVTFSIPLTVTIKVCRGQKSVQSHHCQATQCAMNDDSGIRKSMQEWGQCLFLSFQVWIWTWKRFYAV